MPRQIKLQFGVGQDQQECSLTLETDSLQELQQAARSAAPDAFTEVACRHCTGWQGLWYSPGLSADAAKHVQGAVFTNFSQNFVTDQDVSGIKQGDTLQLVLHANGGKQLPGKVKGQRGHAVMTILSCMNLISDSHHAGENKFFATPQDPHSGRGLRVLCCSGDLAVIHTSPCSGCGSPGQPFLNVPSMF